jgi:putative acetyltransferase
MLSFRPIQPQDDAAVAALIRRVMPEFGADGPGFAIHDPEVDHMSAAYSIPGAAYFVVMDPAGEVAGGAGIMALAGGEAGVCELRKMYFLPGARGQGMGETLLRQCLDVAKELGYRTCYLETLTGMDQALRLYSKLGLSPSAPPWAAPATVPATIGSRWN